MTFHDLTTHLLGNAKNFNWVWLVELIVTGILALFFLFYFNRLFATLVSYGLRAYTWHKFRIYIDVQALQISILGGRVFFKGLRYHGENETILVQNGYITWRYWLRSARQIDLDRYSKESKWPSEEQSTSSKVDKDESSNGIGDEELGPVKKSDNGESRLAVHISGLEWFLYNRTPVYDAIVKDSINLQRRHSKGSEDENGSPASDFDRAVREGNGVMPNGKESNPERTSSSSREGYSLKTDKEDIQMKRRYERLPDDGVASITTRSTVPFSHSEIAAPSQPPPPFILRFLPFYVECTKGAISVGNETTRALLVTTFDKAKGHVDATSSGPEDLFRQVFDFDIEHPIVQMRPNPDFRQTQMTAAERIISLPDFIDQKKHHWWKIDLHLRRRRRKYWHSLRNTLPRFRRSVESLHSTGITEKNTLHGSNWQDSQQVEGQWLGLGRYMNDDGGDDHEAWAHIDYARFSTLLDCPSIQLIFYWDVPGEVKDSASGGLKVIPTADINGSEPPAYGMDLFVRGGSVDYGPWTDRLRAELQNAFFPNPYQSVQPAKRLKPGSTRQSTRMIIRVEIKDEVTLRVPTRESSKDWQWRGRANALRVAANIKNQHERKHFRFRKGAKRTLGPEVRPFGWISVSVDADTTVRYVMDLVPGDKGYSNRLDLDLRSTKATTSVNHALLWRCKSQRVSCDLSNPLGWNSLHRWSFDIKNDALELFLLRDHMFLLIDLISDFTSGPDTDYMTFVPFEYNIGLDFSDLKLYLNANDSNIIDNPCDLEDNAFLVLGFSQLAGTVAIPLRNYRPSQSSVLFTGEGRNAFMDLNTPVWSTLHTFMNEKPVATLKHLELHGSYNYCTSISSELTDSLILDISGSVPRVFLHGFLIRYFMKMRDNYFGDDMHFKTLEEYQETLNSETVHGTALPHAPAKKENDLDVILTIRASQSSALLPANIYSRKENVRFDILLVEADLRFTNYYMDLEVSSSPLEACLESFAAEDPGTSDTLTNSQLFVDGISVFGHRLFGAPPSEPTYVCNWDLSVGHILGECSSAFVRTLAFAIRSFVFTIDEEENALPPTNAAVIHDITFLRAHVDSVRLWLLTEGTALLIELSEVVVDFHDWAGPNFSKQVKVEVPKLALSAVDRKSASRVHEKTARQVETLAYFETSADVQLLNKNAHFAKDRVLQQRHVRFHDQRTRRVDWLLHSQVEGLFPGKQGDWARHPPAMQLPPMPFPAIQSPARAEASTSLRSQTPRSRNSRPSSFLSSSRSGRSVIAREWKRARPISESSKLPARQTTQGNQHADRSNSSTSPAPFHAMDGSSEDITSGATVAFSSPWSAPHFSLQNVRPDTTELPELPPNLPSYDSTPVEPHTDIDGEHGQDVHGAQMGVFCTLPTGLTGFCTPPFFDAIAALLRELQPRHPTDMLDAVQVETMMQVLRSIGPQTNAGSVVDLAVRVPFVHVRLINNVSLPDQEFTVHQDQYDLVVSNGGVNARVRSTIANIDHGDHDIDGPLLIQSSIDQVSVVVSERMGMDYKGHRASAECTLTDLTFWLGSRRRTRTKARVRSIEVAALSKRIEYLASLIQRTEEMTEHLIRDFQDLAPKDNTQHLVYHLTQTESRMADPMFLSRPSYVLRTAKRHLRLSDSWKIMSRLRYIYQTLPEAMKVRVIRHATGKEHELPEDAERHVSSSFDQWRNWDHDRVESTPIMDVVFGRDAMPSKSTRNSDGYEAEISIGHTALILDPGPSQNEVILGNLDLAISGSTTSKTTDHRPSRVVHRTQHIRVQTCLSEFMVNLNWQFVELISNTLEKFNPLGTLPTIEDDQVTHYATPSSYTTKIFVVFGTDQGSITVDTINLSLRMTADKLEGSVVRVLGDEQNEETSVLLTSSTAYANVRSKTRPLLRWRLALPSMYTSIKPKVGANAGVLRVAGKCDELHFDLKDDIIGLLQITQQVVDDEVRFVHKITSSLPKAVQRKSSAGSHVAAQQLEAHVALFLGDYKLKFKLLPKLSYAIAGKVARTSIIPLGHGRSIVNFELKHHSHNFQGDRSQPNETLPRLDMPPINGVLSLLVGNTTTSVEARTTVELIVLEAATVRAFIDAINQPDIARLFINAKGLVDLITAKSEKIFSSQRAELSSAETENPAAVVQYATHATLAGLNIRCTAPALQDHHYRADLNLILGQTFLRIHNRTDKDDTVHERPQFDVNIRQIALGLRRRSRDEEADFGKVALGIQARGFTEEDTDGNKIHVYHASSSGLQIDLYPETASLTIDIAAFLQDRIKSFTLNDEARQFRPLRRLTMAGLEKTPELQPVKDMRDDSSSTQMLFDSVYALDLNSLQARWILPDRQLFSPNREVEDLVFSIEKIDLKTRREGSARLAITNLQLQMVPKSSDPFQRTSNSALLPEMIFNVAYISTKQDRRLAFQAAGKALDLRLASDFIVPASQLQESVAKATTQLREANAYWISGPVSTPKKTTNLLGSKRLASLLIDADFAGAVVNVKARREEDHRSSVFGILKGGKRSRGGRYGQAVPDESASEASLQAPGVAFKVEYGDNGVDDPALNAEIKVAASKNVLFPSVVPLILEISSSIKEMVGEKEQKAETPNLKAQSQGFLPDAVGTADPTAILGRCKLNVGLWIQEQEFSLSCQPIARVAATARFDDIFMTVNTVQAQDQDRFFALVMTFNHLQASVQHVYSRESTASFDVDSIVVSMMNSKHVGSTKGGISAILNISPMKTDINAKQLQDFLLFREIWYPAELRQAPSAPPPPMAASDTQAYVVARYQQVAVAGAFAWNAVISIQELKVQLDLGQGLGKSLFTISKLWASSKKNSDLEQSLCLGFEKVGVESTGRMSGFVELQGFRVRTSIRFPQEATPATKAPLVQGSVGFDHLRVKAAFDYQPFAVADISLFDFLIYNIRPTEEGQRDRLVGILNGDKVQVFCTPSSAAQGLGLYQAVERLIQEKESAYEASLRELDRLLRRKSVFPSSTWTATTADVEDEKAEDNHDGIFSLHTDVIVILQGVNFGVFPGTFFDTQIFKVEATGAQARFAVQTKNEKTHSSLSLMLGELRVALSNVTRANTQALGEVSVPDVIQRSMSSRGGTILKVPRVVATMQTWQAAASNVIEYVFKSTFEGKVDVGWNYSRISFIRGMWSAHARALAHRLGKPLPQSAVKIMTEPQPDAAPGQEKITAVVTVPQSRFDYVALEPPIIDTPQLRDMGEATPPLEWIGLHRERLPNITHQIIIVTLLEVAREVEDAYSRILGSS